ncbi:Golgin subfamily A member 7/ERF4 family-domain-containing protein [Fennellomyces sp. T-0311]|nr:Golgin subfamily A member 7/ERF4 family-domain-containing protein [Fennellomyces sp. T-0311]
MATRSSMPPAVSEHDSVNHQTIEISRRVPDKSIRVDRDYSRGDGITRFSTDYPPLLAGRITPEQFQHTIDGINQLLEDAERVSWNAVFDNVMECITIYTWPILFSTHYQRCIRRLLDFIQHENEILYHQHGVSISNPVRCAYLFVSRSTLPPIFYNSFFLRNSSNSKCTIETFMYKKPILTFTFYLPYKDKSEKMQRELRVKKVRINRT